MSRPISNNLLTPGDIIVANSNPKNLRDVSILITGFRRAAKQSSDNVLRKVNIIFCILRSLGGMFALGSAGSVAPLKMTESISQRE